MLKWLVAVAQEVHIISAKPCDTAESDVGTQCHAIC